MAGTTPGHDGEAEALATWDPYPDSNGAEPGYAGPAISASACQTPLLRYAADRLDSLAAWRTAVSRIAP
jgi:hypothetical protein